MSLVANTILTALNRLIAVPNVMHDLHRLGSPPELFISEELSMNQRTGILLLMLLFGWLFLKLLPADRSKRLAPWAWTFASIFMIYRAAMSFDNFEAVSIRIVFAFVAAAFAFNDFRMNRR